MNNKNASKSKIIKFPSGNMENIQCKNLKTSNKKRLTKSPQKFVTKSIKKKKALTPKQKSIIKKRIFIRNIVKLTSIMSIIFILFFTVKKILFEDVISETMNVSSITSSKEEKVEDFKYSHFTVCIDPGHGGYDGGSKSISGFLEKDLTLDMSLRVGKLLEYKDVNVIYTRTSDEVTWPANNKLDISQRASISNSNDSDVFISIHYNSSKDINNKGIEVWCRFANTESETLAKFINSEFIESKKYIDRGIKYESDGSLAVLKKNNAVAVLLELGFISNSFDNTFIDSEEGKNLSAVCVAEGILKYLKNLSV